jgi:predicted peroxiredoxin
MSRRSFLSQLASLPFLALTGLASGPAQAQTAPAAAGRKSLNIMMKSAWGSDDPTKAAFPFLHGLALTEAGHTVQIFLLGEAVSLMRKSVAEAVVPVGWPPLSQAMDKLVAKKVQIFACGACSRARAVSETDLANYGAKYGSPTIFVGLVEWADRVITE